MFESIFFLCKKFIASNSLSADNSVELFFFFHLQKSQLLKCGKFTNAQNSQEEGSENCECEIIQNICDQLQCDSVICSVLSQAVNK